MLALAPRIAAERDAQRVLEMALDAGLEVLGGERGFLLLRAGDDWRVAAARNIDHETIRRPTFKFSRSVAEEVARTGEPLLTASAVEDPRLAAARSVHQLALQSILCVPIRSPERVLGTIYVENRFSTGRFGERHLRLAQALADQVALALEAGRLERELRERAEELDRARVELARRVESQEDELARLEREVRRSREDVVLRHEYAGIIGRGAAMRRLLETLDRAADTSLPVLIEGPTGTGKELVARALHANGPRRGRPFVSVNCGALPDLLLESELFGHVRGAFTGAERARTWLMRVSSAGTLFLDEVGEMSAAMQVKLLRAIQNGEVTPLGAEKPISTDVRFVAATNRRLAELVPSGRFRQDLFYRLDVIHLDVPPLSERREDVPELAEHFLGRIAQETKTARKTLSRGALAALLRRDFPGNVRELENLLRGAVVFAPGDEIRPQDLAPSRTAEAEVPDLSSGRSRREILRAADRRLVSRFWRMRATSRRPAPGDSRPTLRRMDYGLPPLPAVVVNLDVIALALVVDDLSTLDARPLAALWSPIMCSILGAFDLRPGADLEPLRPLALSLSARQRHRGPDWSGVYAEPRCLLVHERLAIVDPAGGAQPLRSRDGRLALAVNGEIYNHRTLERALARPYEFQTGSDCEVINALYREQGAAGIGRLNGIYAFALWDAAHGRFLLARDPLGVCPLYWGHDADGRLWIASEMKALVPHCGDVSVFPPGHCFDSEAGELVSFYDKPWREYEATWASRRRTSPRERAVPAVDDRCPYGVLLSADSTCQTACAARFAPRVEDDDRGEPAAAPARLHRPRSPDLPRHRSGALGTVHHPFTYRFEEGIDALPDVIRHIESYDVTTVRASTPMFLLARRIKAMGVKMVLSGEGSDEIFGGYLYFHKAPDARAFHKETVRKLDALHLYDCLRANKSMMAWGVEARVPFLDLEFLDLAMSMDAQAKMAGRSRMEKAVLREAFAGALPDRILWRQKEQFSDGVGYGWIDGLKAHAAARVTDAMLAQAAQRFPVNPPQTREAYWYRELFEREFPGDACARTVPGGKSIACSSPAAIAWDPEFANAADPSGRAVAGVHLAPT